jgi:hypothetical protein
MRALLLAFSLTLASLAAAPAMAELRDVAAASDGETGRIWLIFDGQPRAVTAVATADGLRLDIAGVSASQRTVTPYDRGLVETVRIVPAGEGVRIELDGRTGWEGARAELVPGGVLVTLGLPHAAMRAEADAPASPPPAPLPVRQATDESREAGGPAGRTGPGRRPLAADSDPPSSDGVSAAPAPLQTAAAAAAPDRTGMASGSPDAAGPPPAGCAGEAAAVEASPWDDELLHDHAACLAVAGDLDRAAAIYEQMLAFAPENFRALIALAELRAEQGDDAAARELYDQAASHAISDAEATRARARLRALQDGN